MKKARFKYLLVLLLLFPENAYANAGLPLVAVGFPFMIVLFAPVLIIESFIYKVKRDKSLWEIFKVAGLANLYTTIIGYPLSWFFFGSPTYFYL